MMHKSRINTKFSAHERLFGIFTFNRTPFAPPVTRAWSMKIPKKEQHMLLVDHMDGTLVYRRYTTDASDVT